MQPPPRAAAAHEHRHAAVAVMAPEQRIPPHRGTFPGMLADGPPRHRCGAVLWAAGRFVSPTTPQLTYSALPGLVSAAMLEMYGVYGVSGVNFKLLNQKSEKVRERESSKK